MQVLGAHSENVAPSSSGMEPPAKQARIAPGAAAESFRVQRMSDKATLPKRGSAQAAGYDIASAEDCVVPARGKHCISTGLRIAVPPGTYGRVAPRSGLAAKNFIDTGAGVVDEDYRGELKVLLFNHSDTDFTVRVGDRIAQLVLERIATPEVEEVASLDDTERGAGGFGSTGVTQQ